MTISLDLMEQWKRTCDEAIAGGRAFVKVPLDDLSSVLQAAIDNQPGQAGAKVREAGIGFAPDDPAQLGRMWAEERADNQRTLNAVAGVLDEILEALPKQHPMRPRLLAIATELRAG